MRKMKVSFIELGITFCVLTLSQLLLTDRTLADGSSPSLCLLQVGAQLLDQRHPKALLDPLP